MATSQWNTVSPSVGELREEELRTWWKEILNLGARYERIEEPAEDVKCIIEHLLEGHAVSAQVQKELLDEDKWDVGENV